MALSEFDLIRRFFTRQAVKSDLTVLGIGDDCALLAQMPGAELAVTTDTLVEGVHFLADANPENVGYKALAVNLSDLAAMGARPMWVTLALTLPTVDEAWLSGFARGFLTLASLHSVELIGGNISRGPLTITVQAMGAVAAGMALRRSGARAGDRVYVTGLLGQGGLGLQMVLEQTVIDDRSALEHFYRPAPRVDVGLNLLGLASACIDVSDGLAADLGHVLDASGVGASLRWEDLPVSAAVREYMQATGDWLFPLQAGDDYELCFTVQPSEERVLRERMAGLACRYTCIGRMDAGSGLRLERQGVTRELATMGFRHFG
jgi:thiamine-monophosphate kinase